MNNRHGTRPQAATIRAVVEYLASIELNVYGPCADLKSGARFESGSLMDYDADQVLQYRKLYEGDKLFDVNE